MSGSGPDRQPRPATHGGDVDEPRGVVALRLVQGALALWLLVSVALFDRASLLVTGKDVLAGGVLLSLTVAAAAGGTARRFESTACLVVGVLLIAGSVLLEAGPGPQALAGQWNQVVVGVLLVCVGAARTR